MSRGEMAQVVIGANLITPSGRMRKAGDEKEHAHDRRIRRIPCHPPLAPPYLIAGMISAP